MRADGGDVTGRAYECVHVLRHVYGNERVCVSMHGCVKVCEPERVAVRGYGCVCMQVCGFVCKYRHVCE